MKKWMKFVLVIAVISVIFVAGCKDDTTDPDVNGVEILTTYLDANGMSFETLMSGWTILPVDLEPVVDDYYLMDIRAGDIHGATAADPADGIADYHNGHIENSVLSSLGTIVADAANSGGLPIVVVCYTGQEAAHAVMALRLSGHMDAKILKWGIAGWNSDLDLWTGGCAQLDDPNWIAAPGEIVESEVFGYPDWTADTQDGAAILTERISLITSSFGVITNPSVLATPSDYFINNYLAVADVEQYGNITGAYRIHPMNLENLDPNETVVTYCWSGQTSSMVTAYLTLLGYDAKSLKFGMNGMIYDDLQGHKWGGSMDYPYEVTQ